MKNGASLDHSCFIIFNSFTRHTKKEEPRPLEVVFKKIYLTFISRKHMTKCCFKRKGGGGRRIDNCGGVSFFFCFFFIEFLLDAGSPDDGRTRLERERTRKTTADTRDLMDQNYINRE